MKSNSLSNQKGEVVTGVMVGIMVLMMFFGGMHMMHGDHRHEETSRKEEHQHDHQKGEMHHMHDHDDQGEHSDDHEDK